MIHWLHRYIFRGIGILFVIGMITILLLAAGSRGCSAGRSAGRSHSSAPKGHHRHSKPPWIDVFRKHKGGKA
jgi:hypothetical protein